MVCGGGVVGAVPVADCWDLGGNYDVVALPGDGKR